MCEKWVKKLRQIVVCHGDSIELPKYVIKKLLNKMYNGFRLYFSIISQSPQINQSKRTDCYDNQLF